MIGLSRRSALQLTLLSVVIHKHLRAVNSHPTSTFRVNPPRPRNELTPQLRWPMPRGQHLDCIPFHDDFVLSPASVRHLHGATLSITLSSLTLHARQSSIFNQRVFCSVHIF